tara:strand:+ start:853 stop:1167 length:315 start_codon:yes stop_codon:yes gene_type:complete
MGKPVARLGDKTHGTCYHPIHVPPLVTGGTIITGSPDDLTNNKLTARLGDLVLTDCGHHGQIVTASPTVLANSIPVARLGDKVANKAPYIATIITASPDRLADD